MGAFHRGQPEGQLGILIFVFSLFGLGWTEGPSLLQGSLRCLWNSRGWDGGVHIVCASSQVRTGTEPPSYENSSNNNSLRMLTGHAVPTAPLKHFR